MLPKIGFSLQSKYTLPITQVIDLLKQSGFCAVSPLWLPELDLESVAACVRKNGMTLQSIHAPLQGMPLLWEPDTPDAPAVMDNMLRSIDACVRYDVPVLVVHSWQGLHYTFPDTPLDFRFFDHMVQYAGQQGVSIALENLEGAEYLAALIARYADQPHIGFCWDSGHERCYTPNRDFLKEYGHRLLMTHLNDNLGVTHPQGMLQGTDDLHLLPRDGTTDWDDTINRLHRARPQEILNFELKIRPKGDRCTHDLYSNIPLEEFFANAYADACRIATAYFDKKA